MTRSLSFAARHYSVEPGKRKYVKGWKKIYNMEKNKIRYGKKLLDAATKTRSR